MSHSFKFSALYYKQINILGFTIVLCTLYYCAADRTSVTVILFFARALGSGLFQTAYVYTPEVYPTVLRSVGVGSCSGVARLGAMLTPYIAQVYIKVGSHAYSIYIYIRYILVGSYAYSIFSSGIYPGWELCLLHIQLRYISRLGAMLTPYIAQVYPCWELCLLHIQLRYISRLGAVLTPYIAQVYIQVGSYAYSIYSLGYIQDGIYSIYIYLRYISRVGAMLTQYIAQVSSLEAMLTPYIYLRYISRLGAMLTPYTAQVYIQVGSYAYSIYSQEYIKVWSYAYSIFSSGIYQVWELCFLHIQFRYFNVGSNAYSIYSLGILSLEAMLTRYKAYRYVSTPGTFRALCLLLIQLRHISSLGAMLTQIAKVQNKRNSSKTKIMLIFET